MRGEFGGECMYVCVYIYIYCPSRFCKDFPSLLYIYIHLLAKSLCCSPETITILLIGYQFSSVQSRSHVRLFATPWTAARQASLSINNSRSLLKLISIELEMPSNHLILCHPLLLPPSIFPSIRVFSNESALHKLQSIEFQLQHQSFQWTFRTDFLQDGWFGSPCSPRDSQKSSPTPQFKSIGSSALSFLYCQLSHPYMTTGKTIALTRWTFVGKVMCLLFNMLSSLVITFLPRSKRLLISWLRSPSAVILEPPK